MSKDKMTLSEFINAFGALKAKNWVKSERRGSTGIGHTLEKLIGLPENNIASPDLGTIELKAHRINSNSMITLFTFNRKVWKMKQMVCQVLCKISGGLVSVAGTAMFLNLRLRTTA